jgi:uncharacterized protein YlxW (UPF0749 family)
MSEAPGTPPTTRGERRRLRRLLRPRTRRVDLLVAALLAVLGFGLAVQVRSTQSEGLLASARQEDLVQILDELNNRSDRLREEITSLTRTREQLSTGSGDATAALAEARRRTQLLGVVAGTVGATGPGVVVTLQDPETSLSASLLLDAMEELRNAGAEAMQVEGRDPAGSGTRAVRVVASTSFTDTEDGVVVDGTELRAPYRFVVIGDGSTLAGALAIPGGVEDTVRQAGGSVEVARSDTLRVTALHVPQPPRYARPE